MRRRALAGWRWRGFTRYRDRTGFPLRQPVRLVLGLAVLVCGCGRETDESGDVVLADSALVPILADLHLADARAETTGESRDSLRQLSLARNGLDSSSFAARLRDALRTPEDAAAFYDAVTEQLSATVVDVSPSP